MSSLTFSWIWGDRNADKIWYRAHDKYVSTASYIANVSDDIQMPYGDLYAIGKKSFSGKIEQIKEPRKIRFKTDKFGFRNDRQIKDAKLILVGDSFIVGNGTDQSKIPSVWLEKLSGIKVANVAYIGNPYDHEKRLLKMLNQFNPDASLILFYFEGNDFNYISDDKKKSFNFLQKTTTTYHKLSDLKFKYLNSVYPHDQVFYRIIYRNSDYLNLKMINFVKKIFKYKSPEIILGKTQYDKAAVSTYLIGDKEVGFLNRYIEASKSNKPKTYIFKNKYLVKKIKAVFFIPTKSTVYSEWLGYKSTHSTFEYLKEKYSTLKIPTYDLTQVLKKEAKKVLLEGNYVFWRDDTHWNKLGIKSAMREVVLKTSGH